MENDLKINKIYNPNINSSQIDLINYCLNEENEIVLIHGPPGTGKTYTLEELVLQYVMKKKKILVTAVSNTAVNHLSEKLQKLNQFYKLNVRLLRSGKSDKIMKSLEEINLDSLIDRTPQGIALNYIEKNYNYFDVEDKFHIKSRVEILKQKVNNFNKIMYEKSDVVLITCATAGNYALNKYLQDKRKWFDLVIIDEASQALECACWVPMILGQKLVISGDHHQLPPAIKCNHNRDELSYTLFEKLITIYKYKISKMLMVQYRMSQKIMEFCSLEFYEGKLKANEKVANKTLKDIFSEKKYSSLNFGPKFDCLNLFKEGLILVDTSKWKFFEDNTLLSKSNLGEAIIVQYFTQYLQLNYICSEDIGIITPYSSQVELIKSIIKNPFIEVSSVDNYQGREKDVIILSFVRSNTRSEIGFLSDKRRINVSLTRAKKMVIIVCDCKNLGTNIFLEKMIRHYEMNSLKINDQKYFKEIITYFNDKLDISKYSIEYQNQKKVKKQIKIIKKEYKKNEEKKIISQSTNYSLEVNQSDINFSIPKEVFRNTDKSIREKGRKDK